MIILNYRTHKNWQSGNYLSLPALPARAASSVLLLELVVALTIVAVSWDQELSRVLFIHNSIRFGQDIRTKVFRCSPCLNVAHMGD